MSDGPKSTATPVLTMDRVTKEFPVRDGILRRVRRHVHAVSEASITVRPGETLGLVGESGSGKSTLGRLALGLIEPTSGDIHLRGKNIVGLSRGRCVRCDGRRRWCFKIRIRRSTPWCRCE